MPVTAHRAMSVAYLSPAASPEAQNRSRPMTAKIEDAVMADRDDIQMAYVKSDDRHTSQDQQPLQDYHHESKKPHRHQLPDGQMSVPKKYEIKTETRVTSPPKSPEGHKAGHGGPLFEGLPPCRDLMDEVTLMELQAQRERERTERERWEREQWGSRRCQYPAAEAPPQSYSRVRTPPALMISYGAGHRASRTSFPSAPCSPLSNCSSDDFRDRSRTGAGVKKVARRPPRNATGEARTNIKYEEEETHFITYKRVDKRCNWDSILAEFNLRFPKTRRTKPGLQGRFYRQNIHFPQIDEATDTLVFDENGQQAVRPFKIRKQNEFDTRFGLLFRDPVAAMRYDWVDYHDRESIHDRGK